MKKKRPTHAVPYPLNSSPINAEIPKEETSVNEKLKNEMTSSSKVQGNKNEVKSPDYNTVINKNEQTKEKSKQNSKIDEKIESINPANSGISEPSKNKNADKIIENRTVDQPISNPKHNEEEYCFSHEEILLGKYSVPVIMHLSDSIKTPDTFEAFYSPIDRFVGDLDFKEWPKNQGNSIIIKFENTKKQRFVLKRCFHKCIPLNKEGVLKSRELITFLDNSFNDYQISNLLLAHPSGIKPFDFQVTLLRKQNLLVTELLMEDGGESLGLLIESKAIKSDNFRLKILYEISKSLCYLEKLQIGYKDLKADNFLIDLKTLRLKIIDFNISNSKGLGLTKFKEESTELKGFTAGYVAPEVLKNRDYFKINKKILEYNQFKGDIYSWGILVLYLFGAIENRVILEKLDEIKDNINSHKQITDRISKINLNNDLELSTKLHDILKSCLNYDPRLRITFKVLDKLLANLKSINLKNLQTQILMSQQIDYDEKYNKLKEEIKKKDAEIKSLSEKLSLIENELSSYKKIVSENFTTKNQYKEMLLNTFSVHEILEIFKNLYCNIHFSNNTENKQDLMQEFKNQMEGYKREYLYNRKLLHKISLCLKPLLLYSRKPLDLNLNLIINQNLLDNLSLLIIGFFREMQNFYPKIYHLPIEENKSESINESEILYTLPEQSELIPKSCPSCLTKYFIFKDHPSKISEPHLCTNIQKEGNEIVKEYFGRNNQYMRIDNQDLNREEILKIIADAHHLENLLEIDCGYNIDFDDECGLHLFGVIYEKKLLKGIKLDHTSISKEFLMKVIPYLFQEKKEFYLIFDKHLLSEAYLKFIMSKLEIESGKSGFKLFFEGNSENNLNSKTEVINPLDSFHCERIITESSNQSIGYSDIQTKKYPMTEICPPMSCNPTNSLKTCDLRLPEDTENLEILIRRHKSN